MKGTKLDGKKVFLGLLQSISAKKHDLTWLPPYVSLTKYYNFCNILKYFLYFVLYFLNNQSSISILILKLLLRYRWEYT